MSIKKSESHRIPPTSRLVVLCQQALQKRQVPFAGHYGSYGAERHRLDRALVIMDAKAQLSSTKKRISEISDDLKFASPSFFGKYFKRLTGLSPKAFREAEQSIEHTPMPIGPVTGIAGNTF